MHPRLRQNLGWLRPYVMFLGANFKGLALIQKDHFDGWQQAADIDQDEEAANRGDR